jgi:hypothetical protein
MAALVVKFFMSNLKHNRACLKATVRMVRKASRCRLGWELELVQHEVGICKIR